MRGARSCGWSSTRRSPDGLFTKTGAVAEATNPEHALETFRTVCRQAAVADVSIQGWEALDIERPTNTHSDLPITMEWIPLSPPSIRPFM